MSDPITELREKFRDSLVERGMNRYQDGLVETVSDGRWSVKGDESYSDTYESYTVRYDGDKGKYTCSCYDHQWGSAREGSICSHVMAVIVNRRMQRIQQTLGDDDDQDRDYVVDLLDTLWPHESYRDGQRDVMVDAIEAFYDDGARYYTVSAPTGFGKSPVCLTLAQAVGMMERDHGDAQERAHGALTRLEDDGGKEAGFYVTPQNILLDQLREDYGDLSLFASVKGRSHYSCERSEDGASCANGPCRFDDDLDCTGYVPARDQALGAPVSNTNFVMFMVHPQIDHRPGLVVDEAHMMPEYVLGQVEVELREDYLSEYDWDLPEYDTFREYLDWIKPRSIELQSTVESYEMQLKRQSKRGSPSKRLVWQYERSQRLQSKMSRLVRDYETHEEPWVVEYKDDFYDERKEQYVDKVSFRPITPYRFMDDLCFNKGARTVISSATPPGPGLLGLDEDDVVTEAVESPFPVENRPCYVDPIGKMSSSTREDHLEELVEYILDVKYGNTLIHAHTYSFASSIFAALRERVGDNVALQQSDDREGSLESWKESDADIFVSVNMYDGVDLKGDLCRTNIVCVCPFPYLGDPQVQKRKEVEGDRFFNWNTAMRIQQAYGRSTRSEEDWSNTYIVDSNFTWFYKQNKDMFFPWFENALEWK